MKLIRRIDASILAILFACAGATTAVAQAVRSGPPLSYELAFAHREFAYEELPTVSADGHWVAYSVIQPGSGNRDARFQPNGTPSVAVGSRIMLQEVGQPDGRARDICPTGGSCWRPVFSPDGNRVAFYSDADGAPRLWLYELGKTAPRRLANAIIKAKLWVGDEPVWAPDGSELFVPLSPGGSDGSESEAPASNKAADTIVSEFRSGGEILDKVRDGASAPLASYFLRENNAAIGAIGASSGQVREVVSAQASPRPSVLRLSPSGAWVTYLSVFKDKGITSQQGSMDLGLVASRGGPVRVLATDLPVQNTDYYRLNYRWSPKDDRLVYLKDDKLWLVDLRSGDPAPPRQLASGIGTFAPTPLIFTPDGGAVIVGTRVRDEKDYGLPRSQALAIIPLDGSQPRLLEIPDRWELKDVLQATSTTAWQPVPASLTVLGKERATGENVVLRFRTDRVGAPPQLLWKGLARVEGLTGGGQHQFLIGHYQDIATPPGLYRFSSDFRTRTRLAIAEPKFAELSAGAVEMFESAVPLFDGSLGKVRTAVLLPHGAKRGDRLPAIVMMYPGSDASSGAEQFGGGDRITVPTQVFLSRGFAVIYPHLKLGPDGKAGQPAREMTDVLLPQVYRAAELGYIDPNRLGIAGQSYGGYGTAAIISRTNLFRAAVAISGVYDLPGIYGQMAPDGTSFFIGWNEDGQARMGTHPWANLPRYIDNSPYYQADKIHTPLLLVHGDKDMAFNDAQKLFSALRRLGATAQLAAYHGQGHVVNSWNPTHAEDAAKRMVGFFKKYLGDSSPSTLATGEPQ